MAGARELKIIINGVDRTSDAFKKVGGGLSGMAKAAGALALTGVGAVAGMAVGVAKLAAESAGVEQTRATFDKLAVSVGSTGVKAMEGLRAATRGMVADADLLEAGNKFLAMGLADSAEGASELAEVASQLGMAMGEDATASMENFALMMANQSIPRLDSFGISSGQVRSRIEELMEETEGLSREQAFNTAVMEQARETMAKVGEQGTSAASNMARLQASFDNVKKGIGSAFLPILNALLVPLGDLATKHGPAITAWAQTASKWLGDNLPTALEAAGVYFDTVLKPALEAAWEFISTYLIPAFQEAAEFLLENIPIAIEAARVAWEDVLQPALELIWAWIEGRLIPALSSAYAWVKEKLPPAIETLRQAWEDKLKPALDKVWEILGILWDFVRDVLIPGFETFAGGAITVLTAAWADLQEGIEWVQDVFQGFKDAISNFVIPAWIQTIIDAFGAMSDALGGATGGGGGGGAGVVGAGFDVFSPVLAGAGGVPDLTIRLLVVNEGGLVLQDVSTRLSEARERGLDVAVNVHQIGV